MKDIVHEIDNVIEGFTKILDGIDDLSYDDMMTVENGYPFQYSLENYIRSLKEWNKSLYIYEVNLSLHKNPNPVINGLRHHVNSYKAKNLSIEDCREALFEYVNDNSITKENFKGGELYKEREYIGYMTYEGDVYLSADDDLEF